MHAVTQLQRVLSAEGAATNGILVAEMASLPELVRLLNHHRPALLTQAAWCLTNLASGSAAETQQVIDAPHALEKPPAAAAPDFHF